MVTDDLILDVLRTFMKEHGHAPSVRDLQLAVGFGSPSTMQKRLERLREQGSIEWTPGRARTLRVVD